MNSEVFIKELGKYVWRCRETVVEPCQVLNMVLEAAKKATEKPKRKKKGEK